MKKLAVGLVVLLMMGGVSYADLGGEAEAHVWVDVLPNIAVGIPNPNVDIGEIQMGEFEALVTFRIDANVESVNIMIIATDLYKGDVPESLWKIPVQRASSDAGPAGALVEPEMANAMGGHSNVLEWLVGQTIYPNGMSASETETVAFESGQSGHFSQDVDVTVAYDQIDPELPTGEYSGFINTTTLQRSYSTT